MTDVKNLLASIAVTDTEEIKKTVAEIASLSEYKGFIVRHLNGEKHLVIHYKQIHEAREFMVREGITGLEINLSLGYPGLDIDFLKDFTFLEFLSIIHPPMRNIEIVNTLHNLRSLSIDSYFYSKVDFNNFPKLEKCYIHWLPSAENLFNRKTLKKLHVRAYKWKDTSEFGSLTNLEFLSIVNSPIKTLDGLKNLNKLKELNLAYLRNLTSLRGIESLVQLEQLKIETCKKITSIDEVKTLVNLEVFHLINCGEIENIMPVKYLKNLEEFLFYESTNILDGDLSVLLELHKLREVAYVNRKHYSHRREDLPIYKYN